MLWTPLEGLEKIEFKENFKNKNFRRVLKNENKNKYEKINIKCDIIA